MEVRCPANAELTQRGRVKTESTLDHNSLQGRWIYEKQPRICIWTTRPFHAGLGKDTFLLTPLVRARRSTGASWKTNLWTGLTRRRTSQDLANDAEEQEEFRGGQSMSISEFPYSLHITYDPNGMERCRVGNVVSSSRGFRVCPIFRDRFDPKPQCQIFPFRIAEIWAELCLIALAKQVQVEWDCPGQVPHIVTIPFNIAFELRQCKIVRIKGHKTETPKCSGEYFLHSALVLVGRLCDCHAIQVDTVLLE